MVFQDTTLIVSVLLAAGAGAGAATLFRLGKPSGVSPGDASIRVKNGVVKGADAAFRALSLRSGGALRGASFPGDILTPESVATALDSEKRASEAPYRAALPKADGRHTPVMIFPVNGRRGVRTLVVRDISALKSAETLLRETETRYRDLFDGMTEPVVVHRNGVIGDVNAAFTALFGRERHEVLGRDLLTLLVPEEARAEVEARIAARSMEPYETVSSTRDGRRIRVEVTPREIVRDGVTLRAAIVRDITAHKRAEAGLERQLSLFRATLDASLEGILVINRSGHVETFNRRFVTMWGLDPEEVFRQDGELLSGAAKKVADPEAYLRRVRELYDHPEEESDDMVELADGRLFERHSRPQMLNGKAVGRVLTFRDVTERERARRTLRRQVALLDATLEATQEGILVADAAGTPTRCNRLLIGMWGLPEDFPQGATAAQVENPDLIEERRPASANDTDTREIIRLKDGRTLERTVRSLVTDGGAEGSVTGYRDVTERANETEMLRHSADELERRVAERAEELEKTNETLRASNAELEAFSFSVSHDLRAPLRAIDTLTQALAEDCGASLDETGAEYLSRIRSGVRRMGRIMDDLIHLSRANRVELKRESVDLAALAKSVDATLRREHADRAVVFDCPAEATAFGDKRLLRVVLENLIGNAWKYSGKKPAAVILFSFEDKPGGMREFQLRDNGAGFDRAFRHKLFKTFSRLHAPQEFEGTGLGLAIVARIIARHGGTIAADSKPGEGAVFTFTLPRDPTDA